MEVSQAVAAYRAAMDAIAPIANRIERDEHELLYNEQSEEGLRTLLDRLARYEVAYVRAMGHLRSARARINHHAAYDDERLALMGWTRLPRTGETWGSASGG